METKETKVTLCATHEEFEAAPPGAIFPWNYGKKKAEGGNAGHIMQKCVGCGTDSAMLIYDEGTPKPPSPSWEVSGWPDSITFKPSIHHNNPECGWHGWLTNGIYHK